jgi:hypothetical protein
MEDIMDRHYKIRLPRGVEVDIFNLPDNFEEVVKKSFSEFTEGTHEDYTYQDKLAYIDRFIEKLSKYEDVGSEVDKIVKDKFAYEWSTGELLQEEDVYCYEFMQCCYSVGRENQRLYQHFGKQDHHIYDQIMRVLVRVITIVMNYEHRKEVEKCEYH